MQVQKVSSNQNFSGVSKILISTAKGADATIFLSAKGKTVGKHIVNQNGDICGWRKFKGGESIEYSTTDISDLSKPPQKSKAVTLTYKYKNDKGGYFRKWFVFNFNKFNENIRELTSLTGIKRYLTKIEKSAKKTSFKPST